MPVPLPDPETLLLYDGFIRGIAHGIVRGADEVDEVVQQTWVAALTRSAGTIARPRAFLARLLRNVVTDHRRMAERRVRHEQAAARAEATPSVDEILEREAWRKRIVQAVLALAEPYRETVLLRYFENLPPRAIAARQAVPVETVRTRTKRALAQLKRDLAGEHDERELLSALAPLIHLAEAVPVGPLAEPAGASPGTAGTTPLTTGVLLSIKTKGGLLAAAFLGLAAILLWSQWDRDASGVAEGGAGPAAQRVAASTPAEEGSQLRRDSGAAMPTAPRAEVPAVETRADSCALRVSVTWPDGSPAAGIGVSVCPVGTMLARVAGRALTTDRAGAAGFAQLGAGVWRIETNRGTTRDVTLAAGQQLDVEIALPLSPDVRGIVVDPTGQPVAGAEVVLEPDAGPLGGTVAARSDATGRFELRCAGLGAEVSARAKGFAPSITYLCGSDTLGPIEQRIELRRDPSALSGRVLGPDGEPLADALVIFGSSERVFWGDADGRSGDMEPPPLLARSDAQGRFQFTDGLTGRVQVAVISRGLAPHRIALALEPGARRHIELRVPKAASLWGTVRGTTAPMRGVRVSAVMPELTPSERSVWSTANADGKDLDSWSDTLADGLGACTVAETDAEGRYELGPLPPGELEVKFGWGEESLVRKPRLEAGARERLDVTIDSGITLHGRVVDESDRPVPNAMVRVSTEGPDENWREVDRRADGDGRFAVEGRKPGSGFVVALVGAEQKGFRAFHVEGGARGEIGAAEVILRVDSRRVPSIRVIGRLVDTEGQPILRASCFPLYRFGHSSTAMRLSLDDGRFELGLLPPGDLALSIKIADHPGILVGPRRVAANETWDIGELRLSPPVSATFTIDFGDLPLKPSPTLSLRRDWCWALGVEPEFTGNVATVGAIAPGDYEVMLRRDDIAQQVSTVRVEAGRDNAFELRAHRGVAVAVRIRDESGLPAIHPGVMCEVTREDGVRAGGGAHILNAEREARIESLCLAPGRYRVTAEAMTGASGSAELVVTAAKGAPETTVILR